MRLGVIPRNLIPPKYERGMTSEEYLFQLEEWAKSIAMALDEFARGVSKTLTGQTSMPTPFENDQVITVPHTGNIRAVYLPLQVTSSDIDGPAIVVSHAFGEVPKWWTVARFFTYGGVEFLDQILSSDHDSPVSAGYTSATVVSSTSIDGFPGALNRWVNNGVLVGDLIQLDGDLTWHEITVVTSGTPDNLTISPGTTLGAGAYDYVIRRKMTATTAHVRAVNTAGVQGFASVVLVFF